MSNWALLGNDCGSTASSSRVKALYCLPILEPPVWAVKVLSVEDSPPAAIGLVRDTAGLVVAFSAHGQA